jgi:predicted helicase
MSFNNILEKYRKISYSERDKGDRFERLMQAYLMTDPKYAYQVKKVWLWSEFPSKADLGGQDTGIDLVALTHSGDYWAVQCKCFQEKTVIDKAAVDSFLSTSSRTFKNEEMKTVGFAHRFWISTTNKWGSNATEAITNQNPPVSRINLHDLQESPVKWDELDKGISGEISRINKKVLKEHQVIALENTNSHFKQADRGKLIMACGTGKTFTSLRIAENETDGKGLILFLVPSIALLGQTLNAWTADAKEPINPICICSDSGITKKRSKNDDSDSFSVVDLAVPASTNVKTILKQFKQFQQSPNKGMTVVFSTYQSIDVIAEAQAELLKLEQSAGSFGIFDLIICDEAHRTTGVTIADSDESAFVKVHKNDFLKAKKRLYMTATPRLFSDDSKSKADQANAVLCSMDDAKLYGEEMYRIGFGEAVNLNLLTDYKVLILTLNANDIPPALQRMISGDEYEINTDDASKLIGCINALSKQVLGDAGLIKDNDPHPMRRAVAFCQNIKISQSITNSFNTATEVYLDSLPAEKKEQMVSIESKHIDGSMSAPIRDELLGWLKSETIDNECRILTNVRCLSEGVDVPSLDAVLFLSARNSQVDVVQSVGRVMRLSEGKKYGYIIIPVVVPTDVEADVALNDNERYKVVWSVLNALRAHDDRFNAEVNKIELNKKKPGGINVVGTTTSFDSDGNPIDKSADGTSTSNTEFGKQLAIQFEQLQNVVFARMVDKVGDRRYWEQWAKNVAEIAERQVERITRLIADGNSHQSAFENFLGGLQKNINPSITQQEAIEMLSQHIITKPVFEALFEGYSFVKNNPISVSMQTMLDLLQDQAFDKDAETLQKFYDSVKMRASGIDNAEGKQRIIIELYDKFFKSAFPKMVEKLGIVYTPVEVVDFIIHSVNDVLKSEFGRSLSDENIHILDPFTGTGTFITRLLQSGLISQADLLRKYTQEIHANEIVLLAYYIAAVNIENAFHDATLDPDDGIGKEKYIPFDGICLTDTFQLGESDGSDKIFAEMFPQNSERVAAQKKAPLRVIIGNPPYSIGQKSANDNAQNQSYPILDIRIANTYVKLGNSTNVNSLYDSYIKAFRWSSDRLDKNGGVIAFISNGAWLDGNSTEGFRKSLVKEFSSIYVFNLRGNQRTSGELSRKEGGKIFGSGSRTPISITFLIKKPEAKQAKATVHYHDIGDYLNQQDKLKIINQFGSISNNKMSWKTLEPNEHGDWISMRSSAFDGYTPLVPEKKFERETQSFFLINSLGLTTGRDAWAINFSFNKLIDNLNKMVAFYNNQLSYIKEQRELGITTKIDDLINTDANNISWSRGLKRSAENSKEIFIDNKKSTIFNYRPFSKQNVYHSKSLNEYVYQWSKFLPSKNHSNTLICISSSGTTNGLSLLISTTIVDAHFNGDTQCFPLYYYEENKNVQKSLFDTENSDSDFIRRDGVSDFILERAKKQYGKTVSKEDIFYYVYGFLHSPEYREKFASDLKKMLPRLPLVEDVRDFWAFSKAGRKLAELHINYEKVIPYDGVSVNGAELLSFLDTEPQNTTLYLVEKMRFPKKDQKDKIIYNSKITIENIPAEAYDYVVNGKSAIEWIMERYQVTVHKESGIRNDPNDWANEVGNPRYILDLLLSIINVSMQTVDIVNGLPKVSFE